MGRGLSSNMLNRLHTAFDQELCVVPESRSDARRLTMALRAGHVISPAPQLYVLAADWSELKPNERHRSIVRSLAKLHPNWVFSYASAAIMHELYVSFSLLNQVHVLVSRHTNTASCGIFRRHKTSRMEFVTVNGVRVTPIERTAFDCLRGCDFRSGLAIADSALRVLKWTNEQLIESCGAYSRRSVGWKRAIDITAFADRRSESGGESVARAVMIEQGYLIPDLQVPVENLVDGDVYRADFCWRLGKGQRVLGELDGREKYRNPAMTQGRDVVDVLADERLRESRASMYGDKILRFSYADVMNVRRFRSLLDVYGIPSGYAIPAVADPTDPINMAAIRRW
ncbi:MAG: hypothetical protein Q4A01_05565 [Coriobacteriales bacterium]|nr:hypothetical protein [Coriobacteriales bacterium]